MTDGEEEQSTVVNHTHRHSNVPEEVLKPAPSTVELTASAQSLSWLEEDVGAELGRKKKNFFISISWVDGNEKPIFSKDSNLCNVCLLQCLLLKQPWAAEYGQVTRLWEDTAKMCMEQRDDDETGDRQGPHTTRKLHL